MLWTLSGCYTYTRSLCKDLGIGLLISPEKPYTFWLFCDSDWASYSDTRRSVSGFFISLGGSPISWKSKTHHVVALSSAEAEYRSMRRLVGEIAYVIRLLQDLNAPPLLPVPLHCDNHAVIHIAKNPVFHEWTEYIELDCHFVREKLLDALIFLSFIPSSAQLDDLFMKALGGPLYHPTLGKLGVCYLASHLGEGEGEGEGYWRYKYF